MGTNYYFTSKVCQTCGRGEPKRHIGKSTAGWCFALHLHPALEINNLDDWRKLWNEREALIEDEYEQPISPAEMLRIVTVRGWTRKETPPHGYKDWEQFHTKNHSEFGPYGLFRATIDGQRCIGHGAGTWDLYVGDFS